MAPKEKRLPAPEMVTEILMAACAAAAEMDFRLVDMVDMRLSTASLHRFRFSSPFARCILNHTAANEQEWDEDPSGCFARDRFFLRVDSVIHKCNSRVDCELGGERSLAS